MHHARRLAFLALLAITPASAQVTENQGRGKAFTLPRTGIVQFESSEGCMCTNNGKTWPCRKVRGFDLNLANRCNANATFKLVCPEEKTAICHYEIVPSICDEPPLSNVCYAADEPK